MPFLDSIVGLINTGIEDKLNASKVIISLKGISKQMPRTDEDSTHIPAYVDNSGNGEFNAVDDRYSITIYHKCEGLNYEGVEQLDFGDGQLFSRETANMALFCWADRKRLQMTQEWLASVIAGGFPTTTTKAFNQSRLGLSDVAISISNVENNSQTVWAREFQNISYSLPPESILFQVNYTIATVYNKSCIELCEECPPIQEDACTSFCDYTTTTFLFADGTITAIVGADPYPIYAIVPLILSDLVIDPQPLKSALIGLGCNDTMVITVVPQPGTFFYEVTMLRVCNTDCSFYELLGTEDGGPDWAASFTISNCT